MRYQEETHDTIKVLGVSLRLHQPLTPSRTAAEVILLEDVFTIVFLRRNLGSLVAQLHGTVAKVLLGVGVVVRPVAESASALVACVKTG